MNLNLHTPLNSLRLRPNETIILQPYGDTIPVSKRKLELDAPTAQNLLQSRPSQKTLIAQLGKPERLLCVNRSRHSGHTLKKLCNTITQGRIQLRINKRPVHTTLEIAVLNELDDIYWFEVSLDLSFSPHKKLLASLCSAQKQCLSFFFYDFSGNYQCYAGYQKLYLPRRATHTPLLCLQEAVLCCG